MRGQRAERALRTCALPFPNPVCLRVLQAANAFDENEQTLWRTCAANKVGKGVWFNLPMESITKICFNQSQDLVRSGLHTLAAARPCSTMHPPLAVLHQAHARVAQTRPSTR